MFSFLAAFVVLLGAGVYCERLDWPRVLDFVVVVAFIGFICWTFHWHPLVFECALGVMDAVLVLIVFQADIPLPPGSARFLIR